MTASTHEVLRATGATYRQLDYWARLGLLHPTHAGGSGNSRRWPHLEQQVAGLMARLVGAGFTVETAARVARNIRSDRSGRPLRVTLGEGVVVEVDLAPPR